MAFFMDRAIASLFVFALFYLLLSKMKKNSNNNNDCLKVPGNGESLLVELARDTDVIIVGAGVAGSTLACTLAKVFSFSIDRDFYTK